MKVLIVASKNSGRFVPFIVEQARALEHLGCEVEFFGLGGKGIKGYLKNLPVFKEKIKEFRPDVVHAHYGLSGLFANLQRKVPVVTTYHGSDINDRKVLPLSKMSIRLSAWNIFVAKGILEIAAPAKKYSLIPCGVDFTELQLMSKQEARQRMHLQDGKRYLLFAGAFDNLVKNADLAKAAVEHLSTDVELVELKGYDRDEVTLLMCACDAFLMTSFTEGSPQVIKEALACGCPIVSVNVGDVKDRVNGVDGCYVSELHDSKELARLLIKAISFGEKTKGRAKLVADGLENRLVANRILEVYNKVCIR
jgi:glycosyltransferase involved in cell wall biosynthesis